MKARFIFLFVALTIATQAQLNVELLSEVNYPVVSSDIWGYAAPDGREYAIMGTYDGVAVIDVTDPELPIQIDYIRQDTTDWRDIKTWGTYAFVTSEALTDGILVIDLSQLPNRVDHYNALPILPNGDEVGPCHNLYIDEYGFAYLAGCRLIESNGGVLIFDLKQTEGGLDYVNTVNNIYSHDVYARNNILYSSEIDAGVFGVYDVTVKDSIVLQATVETPFRYTHNSWLSEDGTVLFTTDERPNATVAAYNIEDPLSARKLDEYRPEETIGTGVIPHNVHVMDDWLVISYYTDGLKIVDASRPDNLIEVANNDTYFGSQIAFNGAWGAYPFLPSGRVLVSDIQRGLLVMEPVYKRAAHIEGQVFDAVTSQPINNAKVEITDLNLITYSKADGNYKTGTPEEGTYLCTVSKLGYFDKEVTLELKNGELTLTNIFLEPQSEIRLTGTVTDRETGLPVADASIDIFYKGLVYKYKSDATGFFGTLTGFPDDMEIFASKWGYKYTITELSPDGSDLEPTINIELDRGYEDLFELDLGWETSFEGDRGGWLRVKPIGTVPYFFVYINPNNDTDDPGVRAYVTGQSTDLEAGKLVGATSLTSPAIDVTEMDNPVILFDYWLWATDDDIGLTELPLTISLHNGIDSVVVQELRMLERDEVKWFPIELVISDYIDITPDLKFSAFISSDREKYWTEAGIDNFRIVEKDKLDATTELAEEDLFLYPNPTQDQLFIKLPESMTGDVIELRFYDTSGRLAYSRTLVGNNSILHIGEELEAGTYYCQYRTTAHQSQFYRIVKL